jgi:hypothetical protein
MKLLCKHSLSRNGPAVKETTRPNTWSNRDRKGASAPAPNPAAGAAPQQAVLLVSGRCNKVMLTAMNRCGIEAVAERCEDKP